MSTLSGGRGDGQGRVELGRDHPAFAGRPDPRMSRRHALVRLEGARWTVGDLGSRNGTSADGQPLALDRGHVAQHPDALTDPAA